jgi:hypothetical protein
MNPRDDQKKRAVLESLLSAYPYAQVMFDRTLPGVVFPERLMVPAQMIEVGYNMNNPIPDLTLDAIGVSGTLSFGGVKAWVLVPWYAIVGLQGAFDPTSLVVWVSPALAAPAAPAGAPNVVALDSRRAPKDMHAVHMRRMRAGAPTTPGGGAAA